ncbi:circadian-associated transcriptional repressor-like isoform X2 [Sebastes umbrosus]|uniref:circadian-associated transcriptional repressor-like isoform X2 n=1 Tax=Sebastes umbrosus TaxID=72105 RepID=UPI00189CC5BB|nr:circadian-associated transcriptional repressor-like isoform X2 [Sebastes umbrosus]
MSTSDSDYSIDWLASDEDDYDSPKTLSPQHAEESPVPPSSSTSSLRESPTRCLHSGATQRRRRRRSDHCDCKDGGRCGVDADSPAALQTLTVSPVQGFTSISEQLSVESKHHSTRKRAHSAGSDGLCEKTQPDTENELFSQKCAELQCFIQPLSSILRGLRSGRYSERLSSFQESVAMDRIQRIMGVLQNPNMGGRFLSIILKIEEMLQSWFPHIRPDQTDDCSPAKKQKQHRSSASPPPSSPVSLRSSDSSSGLRRLHATSPVVCSPKTPEPTLSRPAASASPLPARCSQEVTQDNAVSSSTDSPHSGPPRRLAANPRLSRGPLPFKIRSPCLERLLQAKESIIAPRTVGDGGGGLS